VPFGRRREPRLHPRGSLSGSSGAAALRHAAGWTASPYRAPSRKQIWLLPFEIVRVERPSAFEFAASAADVASVVGNWGEAGVEFINADVTVARLPIALEIGLAAVDRVEADGIATSTAAVFDRAGAIGTAVVSSLTHAGVTVAPRNR
jgi:hypothetical protein